MLYGDTYLRIDYGAAADDMGTSGLPAMMTVLRNDGRWDVSNALRERARDRLRQAELPRPAMRWIDYGLGGIDGLRST